MDEERGSKHISSISFPTEKTAFIAFFCTSGMVAPSRPPTFRMKHVEYWLSFFRVGPEFPALGVPVFPLLELLATSLAANSAAWEAFSAFAACFASFFAFFFSAASSRCFLVFPFPFLATVFHASSSESIASSSTWASSSPGSPVSTVSLSLSLVFCCRRFLSGVSVFFSLPSIAFFSRSAANFAACTFSFSFPAAVTLSERIFASASFLCFNVSARFSALDGDLMSSFFLTLFPLVSFSRDSGVTNGSAGIGSFDRVLPVIGAGVNPTRFGSNTSIVLDSAPYAHVIPVIESL